MRIALSAENAAEALGLSVPEFLGLVRDGEMPMPIVLGSTLRWSVEGMEQYLNVGREATGAAVIEFARDAFGVDLN